MFLQFIFATVIGPVPVTKNSVDLSLWHVGTQPTGTSVCTGRNATTKDAESVANLLQANMTQSLQKINYSYQSNGKTFTISAAQSYQGFALLDYYRPGDTQRYRFCDKRSDHKVGPLSNEWIKKIFDYYPINSMIEYTKREHANQQCKKVWNGVVSYTQSSARQNTQSYTVAQLRTCTKWSELRMWYSEMLVGRRNYKTSDWQNCIQTWCQQYRGVYQRLMANLKQAETRYTFKIIRLYAKSIRDESDWFIEIRTHPDDYAAMESMRATTFREFMEFNGTQESEKLQYRHSYLNCLECVAKMKKVEQAHQQNPCCGQRFSECDSCTKKSDQFYAKINKKKEPIGVVLEEEYHKEANSWNYFSMQDEDGCEDQRETYTQCLVDWVKRVNTILTAYPSLKWGFDKYAQNACLSTLYPNKDDRKEHIKKLYRKLVMHLHPDKSGGDATKANHFKAIQLCYDVLYKE